jgi:hypothetical protein
MDRTKFYHEVTVDSIKELDFLWNSISDFEMRYDPGYYRVVASDIMRPYLISYKCYGVVDFWWIIMLVNGIECPFVDLQEGQLLMVPNKIDIYDFQRKYRVRSQ